MTIEHRFHAIFAELERLCGIHPDNGHATGAAVQNIKTLTNHHDVPPATQKLITSVAGMAAASMPGEPLAPAGTPATPPPGGWPPAEQPIDTPVPAQVAETETPSAQNADS